MFMATIAIVLTVFNGCKKDEPSIDKAVDSRSKTASHVSINQQVVEIKDGRLSFESSVEFKNAINSILNDKATVKGTAFISRSNFIESQLKSTSASDDNYIEDSDTLVCSDAFRSILNEDLEVQIGDILIKITPIGTILTNVSNKVLLKKIEFNDSFLTNCSKTNNALGIKTDEDLYQNMVYNGIYLFDTYLKLRANNTEQIPQISVLKSAPIETDFNVLSDGKTWAGNILASIFGFSKGDYKRYSNRDYCVDVKFYSQNFLVYSESGIKTKTQKQGWTGIWSKVDSDELVCGYDRLILNEKWPAKLFPSADYIKSIIPPIFTSFDGKLSSYYDLGYSLQKIGDDVLTTRNVFGIEVDITNKDVSKALWTVLQPTWTWGNKTFGSGTNQKVAVRTIKDDLLNSRIETFDRSIRTTNTDKLTYIFGSDFGFIISASYNSGGLSLKNFEGVAARFTYEKGTVLYGCARRGSEWKGIKLTFD